MGFKTRKWRPAWETIQISFILNVRWRNMNILKKHHFVNITLALSQFEHWHHLTQLSNVNRMKLKTSQNCDHRSIREFVIHFAEIKPWQEDDRIKRNSMQQKSFVLLFTSIAMLILENVETHAFLNKTLSERTSFFFWKVLFGVQRILFWKQNISNWDEKKLSRAFVVWCSLLYIFIFSGSK